VLLDEQLVVYDKVVEAARNGANTRKKVVIIVRGGPGTGKSVIAMNLLGDLSAMGLNTHYVTGSKAFTTTIRQIVGSRAAAQVRYFNSYMDKNTENFFRSRMEHTSAPSK
jgi:adenylylsulfate kinase-like enzyme